MMDMMDMIMNRILSSLYTSHIVQRASEVLCQES